MQFTKQSSEVINKSASLSFARNQQSNPSKEYFSNCELMQISTATFQPPESSPPSQKAVQRCQCIVNSISGHSQSPFPYVRVRKEEHLRCKKTQNRKKRKFNWFSVFLSRLWNPLKLLSEWSRLWSWKGREKDSRSSAEVENRKKKLKIPQHPRLLATYGKVVVFPETFSPFSCVGGEGVSEWERERESLS
jgi:hypothetical protein